MGLWSDGNRFAQSFNLDIKITHILTKVSSYPSTERVQWTIDNLKKSVTPAFNLILIIAIVIQQTMFLPIWKGGATWCGVCMDFSSLNFSFWGTQIGVQCLWIFSLLRHRNGLRPNLLVVHDMPVDNHPMISTDTEQLWFQPKNTDSLLWQVPNYHLEVDDCRPHHFQFGISSL